MRWHIYPFGLWRERPVGLAAEALVVVIHDRQNPLPFAEAWAERFSNVQFCLLTVDACCPNPSESDLEKLCTLIKRELGWTGLWQYDRLILVGIGTGSRIALPLASKCTACVGVLACADDFSLDDRLDELANTRMRLIQHAPQRGPRQVHRFEGVVRQLQQQGSDFQAITVDWPLDDEAGLIGAFGGNYLSDLLHSPAPEHLHSIEGQRAC